MKNIATVTLGNRYSPRAYTKPDGTFAVQPPAPLLVYHEFRSAGTVLEHYIDGKLCASVDAPHVAEYVEVWPDAAAAAARVMGAAPVPSKPKKARAR